ncbi:MAG: YerI protein [Haloplasmataceae bacterium]|jgi:Ser/Thr protein kinase RdoA (MazF antagonist)|nr:YerI protein [Haloplasmataceae bacterium]
MVSNKLLDFASECYEFDKNTLHFISDSTNQIYFFTKDNKSYILRFSNRPKEYMHQIQAEMDWLFYLANVEVNVSLPYRNKSGKLLDTYQADDEFYIISAFEMAKGLFWDKNDEKRWNETVFYNWGKVMGDIHNKSKKYIPINDVDKRKDWNGYECLMIDKLRDLPTLKQISHSIIKEILNFSKDKDSYGLIHYDLHPWNFLIDNDQIRVFDFDDSLYGWFAMDIAIALYHALWWGLPDKNNQKNEMALKIIKSFLKGYSSANSLDSYWIRKIPLFMKYRQLCAFTWFYNGNIIDNTLQQMTYNIENGFLFTDYTLDIRLFDLF